MRDMPSEVSVQDVSSSLVEFLSEEHFSFGAIECPPGYVNNAYVEHACVDYDEEEGIGHVHIEVNDGSCFALLVIKQERDG